MLETKSSILIFRVRSTFTATNILPIPDTMCKNLGTVPITQDNNDRYSWKNRPSRWSPMWIIPKTNLVCGGFCRKAGKLVGVQLLLEFLVLLIVDVRYSTVCHVRHIYTALHYYWRSSPFPSPTTHFLLFSSPPILHRSKWAQIQMSEMCLPRTRSVAWRC